MLIIIIIPGTTKKINILPLTLRTYKGNSSTDQCLSL